MNPRMKDRIKEALGLFLAVMSGAAALVSFAVACVGLCRGLEYYQDWSMFWPALGIFAASVLALLFAKFFLLD